MRQFIAILLLLALSGCGPTTKIYIMPESGIIDEGKPNAIIKQTAPGAAIYDDGSIKVQVDTRAPSIWERFVTPILQSAASSARTEVQP